MMPPIFPVVAASAAAQAALGAAPVRFFPFGAAPQDVALPYAVWQTVGGAPENYLGNLPDADVCTVQVDVYAAEPDSAASATLALRDAIEPHAHITLWLGTTRDAATGRWRATFRLDWIVQR